MCRNNYIGRESVEGLELNPRKSCFSQLKSIGISFMHKLYLGVGYRVEGLELLLTHTLEKASAATRLKRGMVYTMNLSSLWGSRE